MLPASSQCGLEVDFGDLAVATFRQGQDLRANVLRRDGTALLEEPHGEDQEPAPDERAHNCYDIPLRLPCGADEEEEAEKHEDDPEDSYDDRCESLHFLTIEPQLLERARSPWPRRSP